MVFYVFKLFFFKIYNLFDVVGSDFYVVFVGWGYRGRIVEVFIFGVEAVFFYVFCRRTFRFYILTVLEQVFLIFRVFGWNSGIRVFGRGGRFILVFRNRYLIFSFFFRYEGSINRDDTIFDFGINTWIFRELKWVGFLISYMCVFCKDYYLSLMFLFYGFDINGFLKYSVLFYFVCFFIDVKFIQYEMYR